MTTAARHAAPATASFRALGTTATVVVADPGAIGEAERLLRDRLDAVDRACSRFRDDSELAALNAADGRETLVGPVLLDAIGAALRAADATGGDVDPTVGSDMAACGYDRDFAMVAGTDPGELRVRATPRPPWRSIQVDRARGTVRLPPGVSLDLGATAKAMAADRAAAAIHNRLGTATLVSLGGDIAVAGTPPAGGWSVRVGDDHRAAGPHDEVVAIAGGGLATSGTTVRRWGGRRRLHHILDPRTGRPCDEVWRTATVAAGSCLDANAASTAAIVRGLSAAGWLGGRGLPARLVGVDGDIVRVGGWPEPQA
ncbi:MAG TPA: FAD:protein FMN transferase [Miltoncostaeaceae bacterium]|nr:FAD:protein FMN transferase [Miltoncostaeaceae bacterium]